MKENSMASSRSHALDAGDNGYHSFLVRAWQEECGWWVQLHHLQSGECQQALLEELQGLVEEIACDVGTIAVNQ